MSSLVLKVSQLNAQLKALLESTFTNIMVEGEISTITYHSSGHLYFTIKDENASLKCVMWRSNVIKLPIRLKEGDHIVVSGNISLYSPRGEYQLIASKIEPFGKGILAIAFEELKKKLKEKGYFDESKKKKLPKFPKRVAVVTAKDSAALQDILKIAKKRWSLVEIIVVDTLVQGETAKYEIANAIKFADNLGCDIILVTRGGGSQEDLWAFNEEIVADAIYNASTPIVSAIGHEIDILISDFVADLRAPTPSGAAEMIFPDINEILFSLDELKENLNKRINSILAQKEREFLQNYEMIINLSPYKKVSKIENEFLKLKLSFREQMEYKISAFSFLIEKLPSDFIDKISYLFSLKTQELNRIKKSLLINSPSIKIDSFIAIF
ncbi:MAG: exodeoxyribonuclease VII large subunit, partial [Epsilonproteobacteria bacterium]|nr:exodeoxyribonuclease VII large subunit [Campylobacterota bacterium]